MKQIGLWILAFLLAASPCFADSQGSVTGGTAGTQSTLAGGIYNSSPPTLSSGQQVGVQLDANGNLKVVSSGSGSGTQNVTPVATATASGVTTVNSSALESNHVLKASAGNLYSVYVTTGATQGWLLTYNGTTAPTAGGAAIAPVDCVYAPANTTTGLAMDGDPPDAYSTGIVAVFSSSGCLTNTASSTVYFKGRVK